MKKILWLACLALVLNVNASCSAGAKLAQDKYVRQLLIGLGTEAAKELIRIMAEPRPDASRSNAKRVAFTNDEWLVAIDQNGNDLTYYGVNLKTRDSLSLRGGTVLDNNQLLVYSWNNSDYRYQLSWQTSNPKAIRLQVFNGREELLNRLLHQTHLPN